MAIMKKTIKKVTKESTKKSSKGVDSVQCPACLGSGLWRPNFTNSPQCAKCKGHGVVK